MDYLTFVYLLERIIKDLGHEVDRRPVVIGEDLNNKYGYSFCGVAPLSSITSGRVNETHYALDLMRGRCAIFADDWSFCGFGNSVKYTLDGRWEKYLKYKSFPYNKGITDATRESLEKLIWQDDRTNPPTLAPMFPWGNHKLLMNENFNSYLTTVDPSRWILYPTLDIPKPLERTRQWVMASLSDHSSCHPHSGSLAFKFLSPKQSDLASRPRRRPL